MDSVGWKRAGVVLSADQIERNIAWLLSNGSAPVKYWTHRDSLITHPTLGRWQLSVLGEGEI
jgi:hypothetical protein